MKYPRPILATTAIAVFGLVAAAQTFQAGPDRAQAAVSTAGPVSWIDPPARIGSAETPESPAAAQPKPLPVATIPPAAEPATAEPPRRVASGHRHARTRLRAAHLRRPAQTRTATADPVAMPRSAPQPAPVAAGRIDPIGDILRGLGFGRDS